MRAYKDPKNFSFSLSSKEFRHLSLVVNGDEAVIEIDIKPDESLNGESPLKLNSYDLGVDIELHEILNQLRFCYPNVKAVSISSKNSNIFCAGANIYMLKQSSHAFKVNFCKYTNETRLFMEEASAKSGLKFLAALNGTAAGGGYELALACDKIILIDDKNANVSLPEVPLLGVLPGTGGLSRVLDKRLVRKDYADIFCTLAEGLKGQKAKAYGLVDEIYTKSAFDEGVKTELLKLKAGNKKTEQKGIAWPKIEPQKQSPGGFSYEYVQVHLDEKTAKIVVHGPKTAEPDNLSAILEKGADLWLIKAFRELDDAILRLRFFHGEQGLWLFDVKGNPHLMLEAEKVLSQSQENWFLREITLHIGRVLKRIENSSRSIFCLVEKQSQFVGVLCELMLLCDRVYALEGAADAHVALSLLSQKNIKGWNDLTRIESRFYGHDAALKNAINHCHGSRLSLEQAKELGLITYLLDEIDYADEVRLAIEERVSLSPDALSAMEHNFRTVGPETLATKIFGRLSAWQNWVFIRENATGENGALTNYGEAKRASFDWQRC